MNVIPIISVRIDEELKRRMEKFAHVNWSEVLRKAVADKGCFRGEAGCEAEA